jgi:GNAT superfamily N-acetyltransferase
VPVTSIEIRTARFDDPVSHEMIVAALAELGVRYGGDGDETPVTAAEFEPPAGRFLLAWADGDLAGCGGWRSRAVDEDVAEIKRMYTVPAWRGRGIASAVLRAIEDSARKAGKKRIVLEAGSRQPEAIALYQKLGYERIANFGYYRDHPGCMSFGRLL